MTSLYDAEASWGQIYVFLVGKLSTQSALAQIYLFKWDVLVLAIFIHQVLVNGFVSALP